MSEIRRVLVVSFFYPPDPAVGGRRVSKFVQYLPEFGWSPTVLTARTFETGNSEPGAAIHATRFASPWSLLPKKRVAQSDRPSRSDRASRGSPPIRWAYSALRHVLPMSSVRMPDATLGWVPFAVRQGRRLLDTGRFDAILSSAGPASSHIVASRLQRASGLPWIADYRDLWSDNHWDKRIAPFRWVESRIERRFLRGAAGLTTVSPAWAERLGRLHDMPAHVIYNGFDPADYAPPFRPEPAFAITYIGSLYWPHQDPEPLFKALKNLSDHFDLDELGFQIRFVGTDPGPLPALAQRHGASRWVRFLPQVPHSQALALQNATTALLFLGWRDPEVDFISAKIFEYLGSGRPILAVAKPGGSISRILQDCGFDDLTDNPDSISARLQAWLREFASTGVLRAAADDQAVARYTRRAQTARLAHLLDEAAAPGAPIG
jgi:glycosyltransferase involved in cell wall biosynthesis